MTLIRVLSVFELVIEGCCLKGVSWGREDGQYEAWECSERTGSEIVGAQVCGKEY